MQIRRGRWPVPIPLSLTGVDNGIVQAVLTVLQGAGMPARVINGEVVVNIAVKEKIPNQDGSRRKLELEQQRGMRRVAFSSQQGNAFVRRYLGAGGTAVFVNEKGLVLARGSNYWLMGNQYVSPYPRCLPEAVIATAVCAGLDLGPELIVRGLQDLSSLLDQGQKC